MSDELERLSELLDDLAAERDPAVRPDLGLDEQDLARAAAFLKAGRADSLVPRPEFLDQLEARMGERGHSPAPLPALISAVSRRGILGRAAAAVAGLAVGAGGATKIAYQQGKNDGAHDEASARLAEEMVPDDRGEWMDTGHTLASLPPGGARRFRAGAVEGFVVHPQAGGALYAVSAACTHMGCAISWMGQSGTFVCPCHGAQYNADGTVLSGIARHPLPFLKLRTHADGRIQVWAVAPQPTTNTLVPYSHP
ncbi:MAG TPA: Rieske (2Fe-2S) protein [Chloroflexota bacterium]|nr:Rieske (2Fe-2S) protein [Chloroflexota bacterium]